MPKLTIDGTAIEVPAGATVLQACELAGWPVQTQLQAIASGLLGKASFTGGLNTALFGLVLQWAMSLIIAAIFVLAADRLPVLRRR